MSIERTAAPESIFWCFSLVWVRESRKSVDKLGPVQMNCFRWPGWPIFSFSSSIILFLGSRKWRHKQYTLHTVNVLPRHKSYFLFFFLSSHNFILIKMMASFWALRNYVFGRNQERKFAQNKHSFISQNVFVENIRRVWQIPARQTF